MMMRMISPLLALLLTSNHVWAEEEKGEKTAAKPGSKSPAEDKLAAFQVDISPAAVSAASIVGLSGSAITTIQTAQDIVAFWNPIESRESKDGKGLSVNPYRLPFVPIGASYYVNGNTLQRMLANTSLSYAENQTEISSLKFKKNAFALDTYFYLKADDDPILMLWKAFKSCTASKTIDDEKNAYIRTEIEAKRMPSPEEIEKYDQRAWTAQSSCDTEEKKRIKWNASRVAISYGQGHIQNDTSGSQKYQLGKKFIITGLFEISDDAGLYMTYQRTRNAVDVTKLATAVELSNSNLLAARYVVGSDKATLRYLLEVSNAKANKGASHEATFKSAVGIDKLVQKGIWLQLRYGKSTTADGKETETKGLMNLSFAMSCMIGKCKEME
ncbi:hypothetical protein CSQ90_06720 [Janthinobacterium sp. BJB303]|nr:hypothetical protein CSQ90_06720 [Janthinobacterium sp. BJB303]